jgi:hypothetical protein
MECDICGQGVENSEELQKHKEFAHPAGVSDQSDKSMDNLEQPDLSEDTPEESPAIEAPVPIH